MAPLPYTNSGARVAFYVVFGIFVLLEWRVRLRSVLNREGTRADRGRLAFVYASVVAGILGGFAFAGACMGQRSATGGGRCSLSGWSS